jgi:hypothetical protein
MKFQLVSTQLIIESKKAKSKASCCCSRPAGHNPPNYPSSSLFQVSLTLSSRCFPFCSHARSCSVVAKDDGQHHTTATFRHALFAARSTRARDSNAFSKFALFRQCIHYRSWHDQSMMALQWQVRYFNMYTALISHRISPPRESTARFRSTEYVSAICISPKSATCSVPPGSFPPIPALPTDFMNE